MKGKKSKIEVKHTPGPRKWENADKVFIRPVDPSLGAWVVHPLGRLSHVSAHLIAAAPELLEAAQEFVGHFENSVGSDTASELLDILKMFQAAIAKAEGR